MPQPLSNATPFSTSTVAPVVSDPTNPVAVINPDQAAQDNAINQKQTYDAAVDSRDTKQLAGLYQMDPKSSVGQAALDAVNHINKTSNQFQSLVDPVEKAGGPGTPAGNIVAAKQFETVKDHPQFGSALVAYLMGQKEAAFNLATGGQEKDSVEFGKDGGRFIRTTNALGQTVKVTDAQGNSLNPQQVEDLGIGYSSYEATQKAKLEIENKKARQEASQLDTKSANAWFNQADSHARLVAPLIGEIQKLKTEIPLPVWQKIVGTVNTGTTVGTGGSTSTQNLGTKSLTTTSNESKSSNLGANANLGGSENPVGGIGGKTLVSAETKSGTTATGTDQTIAGKTSRQDREQTLAKNKESLLAEAQAAGIKDPKQLAVLTRTFDVMAQIKQEQADLASNIKKPSFVSLINTTKLGDQQSQLEAQMLQVLHNNEQLHAYQPFYNESMDSFRKTNTVPDFGQIESQFVGKSKEHENISNKYAGFINETLNRNAQDAAAASVVTNTPIAKELGTPPPENVVKKPATVKNAPVAPPRLSLDQIGKLYANQVRKS